MRGLGKGAARNGAERERVACAHRRRRDPVFACFRLAGFWLWAVAILAAPPAHAQEQSGDEAAMSSAFHAAMRYLPPPFPAMIAPDAVAAAHRTVLFSSLESGPGQRFTGSGLKHAPFGALGTSGFRLIARGGAGQWQDRRRMFEAEAKSDVSLLIGVEQMTGRGALGLYAGAEIATTTRSWTTRAARYLADRRAVQQRETTTEGLRLQIDVWDHPTPETLLHLGFAASSARNELWSRAAAGYRLDMASYLPALPEPTFQRGTWLPWRMVAPSPLFIGPEAELVLGRAYTKWRVGAHVTGLKLMGFTFRLSAGHEHASDGLKGLYATAGLHWSR